MECKCFKSFFKIFVLLILTLSRNVGNDRNLSLLSGIIIIIYHLFWMIVHILKHVAYARIELLKEVDVLLFLLVEHLLLLQFSLLFLVAAGRVVGPVELVLLLGGLGYFV